MKEKSTNFRKVTGFESELKTGVYVSLSLHVGIMLLSIFVSGGFFRFGEPVVYSVTLESGEKLGGIAQAPKEADKKSIPTPAVAEPKKAEPVPEPEKVEDAEVVIPTEKTKPTPKPTPKPVATPVPTPKPKITPKPQPKVQPTPKAPPPKAQPVKAKEPTLQDINQALERAVKKYTGESTDAGGQGYGSTGQGGRGFGGGTQRPPEFFEYQRVLEGYIKQGWRWHDTSAPLQASVCFSLSPAGVVSGVSLCASSGDQKFDESVLRAVQKANPVPVPPVNVYEYFRSVRITFTPQMF